MSLKYPALLIFLAVIIHGCAPRVGQRPFLIAQLCLVDHPNELRFLAELRSIAREANMEFVDRTQETRRDLQQMDLKNSPEIDADRAITLNASRRDGMGFGVGNLGLPNYQVAVGFSAGSNSAEARRFANSIVNRFRQRWRVEIVPPDRGALPLTDC